MSKIHQNLWEMQRNRKVQSHTGEKKKEKTANRNCPWGNSDIWVY